MAVTTVRELAEQTKTPVERLLAQLGEAGVKVTDADAPISADEKKQWLEHLQGKPQRSPLGASSGKKITLKRKEQTELKVAPSRGAKGKTINVEVRKKRTYMKREELPEEAAPVEEQAPVATPEPAMEKAPVEKPVEDQAPVEAPPAEATPAQDAPATEQVEPEASAPVAEKASEPEPEPAEQAVSEEAEAEPVEEVAASEQETTPEPARQEAEPSDLRKRILENLRRAQEQESALIKSREERERAEREEKASRGRKRGKPEKLHVAEGKRGKRRKKGAARTRVKVDTQHGFERPTAPVVREVEIPESITAGDLAQKMAVKASEVIKTLMGMGMMATINESLDQDTAQLVVEEMGHVARTVSANDQEESLLKEVRDVDLDELEQLSRPPVVTIMGHVDHGKTTLLDYVRKARVAAGEAGGITQHIGAYQVEADSGVVTFLDTPGHAAFTAMRARGAAVTDIVILVVAADDGVMPQTEEAVQHARAGNVPIVVAMTKSDKENADPDKVKTELSKLELIPEDWGGDTQFIPVSGITGQGVAQLLEALVLQAELLELKAPVKGPAKAVVVESSLERGRGPVATVLVKGGTLHKGDVILAGQYFGRVRAMFDEKGKPVKEAGPSCPVQVLGLNGTPDAGDDVLVVTDERKAKELASVREDKARDERSKARDFRSGDWASSLGKEKRELPLLLKCDVRGSAEALADALVKMSTDEVVIKIVANGVGGISESDVDLAIASNAMIIGFNTRADNVARRRAAESGLELRYYSVIYDVINDVRDAASGLLGTETAEKIVGVAMVRDVFRSSKFGAVAGCLVEEGQVRRGLPIRVLRDNVVIYEGELESLRRHKDDVQKVDAGTECGIAVKNYDDVREADRIEVFERVEVQRTLEEATE